jgi:hypothetical protein
MQDAACTSTSSTTALHALLRLLLPPAAAAPAVSACCGGCAAAAPLGSRVPKAHLGGGLAHLDEILLHLGHHLVQDLLWILGGRDCGRVKKGGCGCGQVEGRERAASAAPTAAQNTPTAAGVGEGARGCRPAACMGSCRPPLTDLVGIALEHAGDPGEQVGLHDDAGPPAPSCALRLDRGAANCCAGSGPTVESVSAVGGS